MAEGNNKEATILLNNVHCHRREKGMTDKDFIITISGSEEEGTPVLLLLSNMKMTMWVMMSY